MDEKIRILATASKLSGEDLAAFLGREGVHPGELDQWRFALDSQGKTGVAVTKRLAALERELARKEKALAEVAALLVLKKSSRTCTRWTRTTPRTRTTRPDLGAHRRCAASRRPLVDSLRGSRHLEPHHRALASRSGGERPAFRASYATRQCPQ